MRKSSRLASIHDDDDADDNFDSKAVENPEAAVASKTKKFVPTIPTVRRKKLVVEDDDEDEESQKKTDLKSSSTKTNTNGNTAKLSTSNTRSSTRRQPITAASVVSGPLSMGPAAMARPSRSSSTGPIIPITRSSTITTKTFSKSPTDEVKPLADSVPVEEAFASINFELGDEMLKPVALTAPSYNPSAEPFIHFEEGKIYLFQMPPILPTPLATPEGSSKDQQAEKWPSAAQGRYGKLRRYKSGRIALVLENGVEFSISSSVESYTNTDAPTNSSLIAIDPEFAQCFNIGTIDSKLVCTPEFERFQKLEL